ncbi:MAG: LuxR family transcriptional regulator [Flavobacteriales bacterium]|nr:LuxR family transcriptional regulator [Flavobacteriales bacterium]
MRFYTTYLLVCLSVISSATSLTDMKDSLEYYIQNENSEKFEIILNKIKKHSSIVKNEDIASNIFLQVSDFYQFVLFDYDSALKYSYQARDVAVLNSNFEDLASAYYQISLIYESERMMDSSLYHAENALKFAKRSGNYKSVLHKYGNNAHLLRVANKFYLAKAMLYNGLDWSLQQNIKDPYAHNMLMIDLASIYFHIGEYDLALKLLNQAKKYFDSRNLIGTGHLTMNQLLGSIYSSIDEPDSALKYLSRALLVAEEIKNYSVRLALFNSIAKEYIRTNEYELAEKYNERFKRELDKRSSSIYLEVYNLNKAALANGKNLPHAALTALKNFEKGRYFKQSKLLRIRYYQTVLKSRLLLSDFQNGIVVLKKMRILQKELRHEEFTRQSEMMRASFQSRANLLNIQNNKRQLSLDLDLLQVAKIKSQILILCLFVVILVGVIGFTFYRYYRKINLERESIYLEKIQNLKNAFLHDTKQLVLLRKELESSTNIQEVRNIVQDLNASDLESFEMSFDQLFPKFFIPTERSGIQLTKTEKTYCRLKRFKLSNKEIAQILNVSPDSVKKVLTRLRKKLNVSSNQELITYLS